MHRTHKLGETCLLTFVSIHQNGDAGGNLPLGFYNGVRWHSSVTHESLVAMKKLRPE